MAINCDLCSRKMSEKVMSDGCVCLTSSWEMFFCKRCYPRILNIIKEAEEKYKRFHHKRSHKDFEKDLFLWYKLQELSYIEFLRKNLNYSQREETKYG